MLKRFGILLLALMLPVQALAQASPRQTYIASVAAQATTGAILLSIEASATQGFRLVSWCVGITNATAAAGVTVTVQRRDTGASSGGTALTAEGTGTTVVSKMNPGHPNFPGIARLGGTPGTAAAVLDQQGFQVGELGAGAADHPGPAPICKSYGQDSGSPNPIVPAGVINGVSINVSAAGAGGLAFGSISAIVEMLQP
jgi:hypothetical protein